MFKTAHCTCEWQHVELRPINFLQSLRKLGCANLYTVTLLVYWSNLAKCMPSCHHQYLLSMLVGISFQFAE